MTSQLDASVEFLISTDGDYFTIEDATKGVIEGGYGLAGPIWTAVDEYAYSVKTARGRDDELAPVDSGRMTVGLRNYDGAFLPGVFGDIYLRDDADEVLTDDAGDPLTVGLPFLLDELVAGVGCRFKVDGVVVFTGNVETWEYLYNADGFVDVRVVVTDALADLALTRFDDWTPTDNQLSGARIVDVLGHINYLFDASAIDTGRSTLQAPAISSGGNVLNYLQDVALAELGGLVASADNVVTFRDRSTFWGHTASVAFADDGTGPGFSGISVANGAGLRRERVSVQREDGVVQTVDRSTGRSFRDLSLSGLLLSTDTQAKNMAGFLSSQYADPVARVAAIEVTLERLSPSDLADVLAIEWGDAVSVTWTPTGRFAPVEAQRSFVQSIAVHRSVNSATVMTFGFSLAPVPDLFTIEDSTLGVLNGTGVLAF